MTLEKGIHRTVIATCLFLAVFNTITSDYAQAVFCAGCAIYLWRIEVP